MQNYQQKMTMFLLFYPNQWHSFAHDLQTLQAVHALVKLGIARLNGYHQFCLDSPSEAFIALEF